MKRSLLILLFVSLTSQVWSQEVYSHQFSNAPDTSRYELVQSESGLRYTFEIDKFTGQVWQLVLTSDGALAWQRITFLDTELPSESDDKVNYQLMISGLGARYIFLLHLATGKTWQLTEDTETGMLFWSQFY